MMLSEDVKIRQVKAAQSAAASDVTSDAVDMTGYDGVIFVAVYGTAAADNIIHAEQSANNSDWTDIAGSEVNDAGSTTKVQFVDIVQPAARYIRCIAERGTSSTCDQIIAIQYRARDAGIDNTVVGTIDGETLVAPIAGAK